MERIVHRQKKPARKQAPFLNIDKNIEYWSDISNILNLPVDWRKSVCLQKCIGLAEGFAPEKSSVCG